jgi:hypothetical protein
VSDNLWRRCSACKKPIALGAVYYVCNVSTCNQKRTGLAFCDVSCWEVHLPVARHRKAWALEKTAPRTPSPPERTPAPKPREPRRILPKPSPPAASAASNSDAELATAREDVPKEILIVASRLKEYVRKRSGFNTSERVLGPLSEILRDVVDEAIKSAAQDERKTVLDRDVPRRRPGP